MSFEPERPAGLPPLPKIKQMALLAKARNYAQLDMYAQITLRSVPNDAHAHFAAAWVGHHFGLLGHAHRHLQHSLTSDRPVALLAQDLGIPSDELDALLDTTKDADNELGVYWHNRTSVKPKFHLIKAWGFGFGSEMSALMGQAYVAELCGRIPVVHWGRNFLYRPEAGTDCVFDRFFQPFNRHTLEQIVPLATDCYPPKWQPQNLMLEDHNKKSGEHSMQSALHFLNRTEPLTVADYYSGVINSRPWAPESHPLSHLSFDDTYRYLAKKYLRPQADIVAEAEAFVAANLPGKFIAVHARGSDKDEGYRDLTSIPGQTMQAAKQRLAQADADTKLFLMTDDASLLRGYQAAFGSQLVTADVQRSSSLVGVHYNQDTNKELAGREMLIDMLVAARADCFIGLGLSNPSQLIMYMGDFDDENYILFGENRLKQFNTHLYKTISVSV